MAWKSGSASFAMPRPTILQTAFVFACLTIAHGSVRDKISNIVARPWWNHNYIVPQTLLERSEIYAGDVSRFKKFMTKIIEGKGEPSLTIIPVLGHAWASPADLLAWEHAWHGVPRS